MTNDHSSLRPAVLVLGLWLALSIGLASQGIYRNAPDSPPIALLLSLLVPPTLFAAFYRLSSGFRRYVLGIDLSFLTALQGWRVIGGMFLVLMTYDILPAVFAWPAGIGDLIVGVYAPFVVLALVWRSANWRGHVILLNVLGLLDFVGAIGSGVLSGNNPLGVLRGDVATDAMLLLPLSIIPTFAVPAWILIHIASLLQLKQVPAETAA